VAKVVMIGKISGGRFVDNGDGTSTHIEYPGPGEEFETDDATARKLVDQCMAYVPEETAVESAAMNTKVGRRG
jgi:hypothetical protein